MDTSKTAIYKILASAIVLVVGYTAIMHVGGHYDAADAARAQSATQYSIGSAEVSAADENAASQEVYHQMMEDSAREHQLVGGSKEEKTGAALQRAGSELQQ
jgi:hypothetical protein